MSNHITELVFILDRSGSMQGLEADTIGGFNGLLEKQRAQEGECYVSTVLFNHASQVLYDRVRLEDVQPMTERDYCVGGTTALLDAVGDAVRHIKTIHKYARPEDVPENTLFVITTDGMENATRRYSADQVRQLIQQQKTESGWEFLFLGANIDAVQTAARCGIDSARAVNYRADSQGTQLLYDTLSEAVTQVRTSAPLAQGWGDTLELDCRRRGRKK